MNDHTYTMDIVSSAGRILLSLGDDLDKAIATIERADSLGPILEPTAYATGGSARLQEQRSVLRQAIALRDACEALRPKVGTGVGDQLPLLGQAGA